MLKNYQMVPCAAECFIYYSWSWSIGPDKDFKAV